MPGFLSRIYRKIRERFEKKQLEKKLIAKKLADAEKKKNEALKKFKGRRDADKTNKAFKKTLETHHGKYDTSPAHKFIDKKIKGEPGKVGSEEKRILAYKDARKKIKRVRELRRKLAARK